MFCFVQTSKDTMDTKISQSSHWTSDLTETTSMKQYKTHHITVVFWITATHPCKKKVYWRQPRQGQFHGIYNVFNGNSCLVWMGKKVTAQSAFLQNKKEGRKEAKKERKTGLASTRDKLLNDSDIGKWKVGYSWNPFTSFTLEEIHAWIHSGKGPT